MKIKDTTKQILEICLLSLVFFVCIFIYDRSQRLNYLYQNNLTKYQQLETAYLQEMVFLKDLNFDPNALPTKELALKESFIKLQEEHKDALMTYEKFVITKDTEQRKKIIQQTYIATQKFVDYRNKFYRENSKLEKEINEYNQQISEYNNYLTTFPNYFLAKALDYVPVKTTF